MCVCDVGIKGNVLGSGRCFKVERLPNDEICITVMRSAEHIVAVRPGTVVDFKVAFQQRQIQRVSAVGLCRKLVVSIACSPIVKATAIIIVGGITRQTQDCRYKQKIELFHVNNLLVKNLALSYKNN